VGRTTRVLLEWEKKVSSTVVGTRGDWFKARGGNDKGGKKPWAVTQGERPTPELLQWLEWGNRRGELRQSGGKKGPLRTKRGERD